MQLPESPTLFTDVFVFLFGLCVGSFLNVLGLRSIKEESIISPPSHCPQCKHTLGFLDLVPVVSYIMLKGKCRYCHGSIAWYYPFVEAITGVAFVLVTHHWGYSVPAVGMLIFASTLIAVTLTDFKDKLIPHEITYPSILMGICFSAVVRNDFAGTMAGIGASYIIFDFIAFFGLKIYLKFHPLDDKEDKKDESEEEEVSELLDETFDIKEEPAEEFEVMGGGDAVLAAVIAAWLGSWALAIALLVGFGVGAIMGMIYLLIELKKRNMLALCQKPALIGGTIGVLLTVGLYALLSRLAIEPPPLTPWLISGTLSFLAGAMAGTLTIASGISKPFPFGPALAIGAVVAMIYQPFGSIFPGGA